MYFINFIYLKKENSLICMDTQGYEGIILKGAKQNLQKKIPILLEFSPKLMKHYNSFDNFKLLFPYYSTFFNLNDERTRAQTFLLLTRKLSAF